MTLTIPKRRVSKFFLREGEAEDYLRGLLQAHPESEPIKTENLNAEDKARGYSSPRINGWNVHHWSIDDDDYRD